LTVQAHRRLPQPFGETAMSATSSLPSCDTSDLSRREILAIGRGISFGAEYLASSSFREILRRATRRHDHTIGRQGLRCGASVWQQLRQVRAEPARPATHWRCRTADKPAALKVNVSTVVTGVQSGRWVSPTGANFWDEAGQAPSWGLHLRPAPLCRQSWITCSRRWQEEPNRQPARKTSLLF